MTFKVDLTVFLNTPTPEKARKIVDKIAAATSLDVSGAKVERYWKDKELFKATVSLPFRGMTPRNAFFKVLSRLKPIASRWVVTIPDEEDDFEFSGAVNKGESRIQGIDSVFLNVYKPADLELDFGTESSPLTWLGLSDEHSVASVA